MRNDDALSPVIAAMLILAVAVTAIAVYQTQIVPDLKEQAEIEHMQEVESAFLAFTSDLETAASLKTYGSFKERIPLGGGNTMFDQTRSSGTLEIVQEDYPVMWVNITAENETVVNRPSSLVNITYTPVSNFWTDQGYEWREGYVNVTKGTVSTPLEYTSMEEVRESMPEWTFAASLFEVEHEGRWDIDINETTGYPDNYSAWRFNCTGLTVSLVSFTTVSDNGFASGNSIATLDIQSTVNTTRYNSSNITVAVRNQEGGSTDPYPLTTTLRNAVSDAFDGINTTSYGNIEDCNTTGGNKYNTTTITFKDPVAVTLRQVNITVSVH